MNPRLRNINVPFTYCLRRRQAETVGTLVAKSSARLFDAPPHEIAEADVHRHVEDVHAGVWLERRTGQASTLDRHTFCKDCGAVRQLENRGRPLSYFIQGVANIVEFLNRRRLGKITQAEARLMMRMVSDERDLADCYDTTFEIQVHSFMRVVRHFRPELSEDIVMHSLFRRASGGRRR